MTESNEMNKSNQKPNNDSNEVDKNTQNIEKILDQIPIFKTLKIDNIKLIAKSSKILNYKIGWPIYFPKDIQSNVAIILEGEARLLDSSEKNIETIAKLGVGSFIGIASLLRTSNCEQINASNNVKALLIPNEIIIKLYENEKEFYHWCNTTLNPSEVLYIAKMICERSTRSDINLRSAFNLLIKYSQLEDYSNLEILKNKKYFIASANIKGKEIGDIIESKSDIEILPPFSSRIISIPINIYNQFQQIKNNDEKIVTEDSNNPDNSKESNVEFAKLIPEYTTIDFNQYALKKKDEVIRAKGNIQEAMACLKMLANELDIPFRTDTIERMLRDEVRRDKEITLQLCAELLGVMGLNSSRHQLDSKLGIAIPESSIILWKKSFGLIKKSNSKGLLIASPSDGLVHIKTEDLINTFPDGISVLMSHKTNLTQNKKFGLDWFLPSIKKFKSSLILVLIASFVVQLFGLANPLLIQVIIDKVISQRSLDTLQVLGIGLVFVTILGGVLGSLRTFLFAETTNRIDTRIGSEVIDHLLRVPLNYFDKRPVGELGSRVSELERIREFLTGQALTTILDAVFSIIYIVVMCFYSLALSLLALGVVPVQIFITLLGSPLIRRQIREVAKQNAKTQSHLIEVLTGIQTVKAQNVETISRWKWQELYSKYISRTFERTITSSTLGQISQVLQQLSQLLVLWYGAVLVLRGELTLGQLIAFRIISGYVTQPLLRLSTIWQNIQELKVSFERLADIVDTPEESDEMDKGNIPLPEIKGNIEFKNVSFEFNKGSEKILKNISLKINAGTFVGIAGQSGSGKSTLMKLLPRLYSIEEGKIIIDGYDISKTELYSLRRQIGIVPQEPLLFSGSVSENIAVTNPEIGSEEIIKAAKIACCHDFIMDLPNGYSTNVGERGSRLSGGQRQRIAIARTLVSKPKLLILDEATSALDYDTEKKVCDNLKNNSEGKTVFFITHRLTTIKNSNIIIMMSEGLIAETGSHEELFHRKGRYYALYRQQESD
tara:strand:+ start:2495 stop:5512 length:3018 start_codon:yes stop_codon:yes gene_type:complete